MPNNSRPLRLRLARALPLAMAAAAHSPKASLGPEVSPVCGTPSEHGQFHCYAGGRPLQSALGLPNTPLLGIYGPSYWPSLPLVLVTLPFETLAAALPAGVCAQLKGIASERVDACVACFSHVPEAPSQKLVSSASNEINVMLHYWRLQSVAAEWGSREIKADLDVFADCASGAAPLYLSHADGGLPLGTSSAAPRSVVVHGGGGIAVSPNNCQFALRASSGDCASFVVCARCPSAPATAGGAAVPEPEPWRSGSGGGSSGTPSGDRAVLMVCVLPRDEAAEAAVRAAVAAAPQRADAVLNTLAASCGHEAGCAAILRSAADIIGSGSESAPVSVPSPGPGRKPSV